MFTFRITAVRAIAGLSPIKQHERENGSYTRLIECTTAPRGITTIPSRMT